MSPSAPRRRARRRRGIDFASIAVAPLGIVVILAAQIFEGLSVRSLLHGTAALIVFGGTLGAVLVTFSPAEVIRAIQAAFRGYLLADDDTQTLATSLVAFSVRAHRHGVLALDPEIDNLTDPFFRDGLILVVDNTPAATLREFLAAEKAARDADEEAPARVFEAAAGYAPTLGILGAVLGLIRVMEHLGAPATLGAGIAVAFVATIYGVGVANLVLLPMAGRLRERAALAARRRDLISEGLRAIQERLNPRLVAQRLRLYSPHAPPVEPVSPGLAASWPGHPQGPA